MLPAIQLDDQPLPACNNEIGDIPSSVPAAELEAAEPAIAQVPKPMLGIGLEFRRRLRVFSIRECMRKISFCPLPASGRGEGIACAPVAHACDIVRDRTPFTLAGEFTFLPPACGEGWVRAIGARPHEHLRPLPSVSPIGTSPLAMGLFASGMICYFLLGVAALPNLEFPAIFVTASSSWRQRRRDGGRPWPRRWSATSADSRHRLDQFVEQREQRVGVPQLQR